MKIAFIGLGEAGSALIAGWGAPRANQITAYDIKIEAPETAEEIRTRCNDLNIQCCTSTAQALTGADIVFCTVTADQAVSAATNASADLGQGTIWCDLNSCAPSSKRTAADIIESAGGRYVDVAVMAPVHPQLNMVPLLVAGPHAADTAALLRTLPMSPRVVEGPIGAASSIKMIRSVMVKGLEALTAECTLAAVAAGVEDEVLTSLNKSHPGTDWNAQAAYNFERALVHGTRRAAEMVEVAKTLRELGLPDDMATATIRWQNRIADTKVTPPQNAHEVGTKPIADQLLPILKRT